MKTLSVLKCVSLLVSLNSVMLAQNVVGTLISRNATFTRSVGNSDAGVSVNLTGRADQLTALLPSGVTARQFKVSGSAVGNASLFGTTHQAVSVSGYGRVRNGNWNTGLLDLFLPSNVINAASYVPGNLYAAGFAVRLGGQTVFSPSFSGTVDATISRSTSLNLPTIASYSGTFWLGPVPIAVGVDAGANASLGMSAALRPLTLSASLSGFATGHAFGRAHAGIGAFCVTLGGVRADLRLLDTRLNLSLAASQAAGLSGTISYTMNTVRILISLFGSYCIGSWSLPIKDLTFGSVSGTRNLL